MADWPEKPRTVNEVAFERLQALILAGHIAPGERLDERHLSDLVGVSRTPLRQAVGRLANLGLVEYRAYRGHFLREYTARQALELYEVRKALEGLAARAAANAATPDEIETLRSIVAAGDEALKQSDLPAFEAADRAFHTTVAAMSKNDFLIAQLLNLALPVQFLRRIANLELPVASQTTGDRRQVLEAIAARDVVRAEAAMVSHIQAVQDHVVRHLASARGPETSEAR